jgi:hypothetical protein
MDKLIREQATGDVLQRALKNLNECRELLTPTTFGFSDTNKNGVRTMAEGREGLARMVSQIASAHVNSLAREHDPAVLENRLAYDADLERIRQGAMALLEMVSETQLANGIDIMQMVDTFTENLQTSRKRSEALDLAMREVDEYNKRFAYRPEEKPAAAPTAPAAPEAPMAQ